MEERRKHTRSSLAIKAKFFGSNGWEDCIITEASRNGLSVKFYTREKITEGSLICFKVFLPSEPNPVEVNGTIKWIKQQGRYFAGGVEWLQIDRGAK
jgi:hypothetical protein